MPNDQNEQELQDHLQQRDPRFREALRLLRINLGDAVALATTYRNRTIELISTEVEIVRMARLQDAGSQQRQILSALPEELLLETDKPIPGMHELQTMYRNTMASQVVNRIHQERVVLPFAVGAAMISVVLEGRRGQTETTTETAENPQLPEIA